MTQQTTRLTTRILRTALLACSTGLLASAADAQEVRILRAPGGEQREMVLERPSNRPMIGVATVMESERGDTLGLLVESVTSGSPAEKAGIKAGDRLQAANGTSLRADRADAGRDDYAGALSRRLQRVIADAKPGEAITLRVLTGTASREVKVVPAAFTTVADRSMPRGPQADRAVIGVMVGSTGTLRDTAGVFIQSVVKDGPAEKAGIYEGDRIASINGVSLRVSREDAADAEVASGRGERLQEEVAKLKAGDAAELVVVSGGRSRTVRVTTGKASDLPAMEQEVEFNWQGTVPGMQMIPRMQELPRMRMVPGMPIPPGGETEMQVEVRKMPNGETIIERRGAPGGEMTMHDTPGQATVTIERSGPGEENVIVRRGTPGAAAAPSPNVVIQKKVRIIL